MRISPNRRYIQSIVQPRPPGDEYDPTYGQPYQIDKKFIAGYFDMEQGTFTRNSEYDPTYDAALLKTAVNVDIQREQNPVDPLERLRAAYGNEPEHRASPLSAPQIPPGEGTEDTYIW